MKRYSFVYLSICLAATFLFTHCGPDQKKNKQEDIILPDSIDTEGMVQDDEDCPYDTYTICNRGLSFAPLGLKVADLHLEDIEEVEEADSLDTEMGYVRLNRSFRFGDGFILLEGDPLTETRATDEDISNSNLSRIRIEASDFKTVDGVHSGMSIAEIKKLYSAEEMDIISFASIPQFKDNPAYHFLILNPVKHPNITYLLPDPNHVLYESLNTEEISLNDLPDEGKISGIVVSV